MLGVAAPSDKKGTDFRVNPKKKKEKEKRVVRLLSPFELLECCRLPKNLNPNVIYRLPKCHMAGVRNGKRSGSSIFHEKEEKNDVNLLQKPKNM